MDFSLIFILHLIAGVFAGRSLSIEKLYYILKYHGKFYMKKSINKNLPISAFHTFWGHPQMMSKISKQKMHFSFNF
jgi:hypothetical protein